MSLFRMVSLKFSYKFPRSVVWVIAMAAVFLLLSLFSQFVVRPEVSAVTRAILQIVTVSNELPQSVNPKADLTAMLKSVAHLPGEPIRLPFFKLQDGKTSLTHFVYSITLDEKTLAENYVLLDQDAHQPANTYGLLFIQILNGGDFYLNGQWVAGLAKSTNKVRWMWHEPFVVPLPSRLLKIDGTANVLTVSQSTFEPYISIPRLYFGRTEELNRLYRVADFIGSTLSDVIEMLCFAAGLLLLGLWSVSPKERIYALLASVNILWAVMFTVFRLQQSSADMLELWRWVIYACQGGVICLLATLVLVLVERTPSKWAQRAIVGLAGSAAVVYAIGGSATAPFLDLFWRPVALLLYAYATARLVTYCWKTSSVPASLFLLQSVLLILLAFHDYAVQVRLIDQLSNSGLEVGWSRLFFEHIHLRHLAIPPLLLLAGYILLVQHRKNVFELGNSKLFLEKRESELVEIHHKRELIALSEATLSERERIYQDIHDGIGSQLVKAIFSLRSAGPDSAAVVQNLQACLQDLRLVIDAQPESNVDIETTVFAFCVTQELHLEGSGLAITYHVGSESTVYTDPKVNLNVLRVLQESLNNTIKHAGATFIDVRLKLSEFHLTLIITDNGHGDRKPPIQLSGEQSAFGSSGNRGITGLSLRAADIGGKYTINITDSGTTVRLSIPLPSNADMNESRAESANGAHEASLHHARTST